MHASGHVFGCGTLETYWQRGQERLWLKESMKGKEMSVLKGTYGHLEIFHQYYVFKFSEAIVSEHWAVRRRCAGHGCTIVNETIHKMQWNE